MFLWLAAFLLLGKCRGQETATPGFEGRSQRAQKSGIRDVRADSEESRNEAANAFDGDPKTIWHTPWHKRPTAYPHYLQIEFESSKSVRGFTALPRQDGVRNGWICDYAIYASDDGKNWGQPVKRGTFEPTKDLKTVRFDSAVSGRFFQFVALSSYAGQYASLAEFSILEESSNQSGEPKPATQTTRISIDGNSDGLVFDGVGAVSSGGSSRLLVDYPERERSQILDYLFRPNYGAALQILKVEIGADTDATCGAEPSHQRTPGKIESDLGYEWWLMKEARKRNPRVKLCGLAWGAPGWLKGGFWSDDNIRYTIAWLDCARQNGLRIDYLGGGNERGWDARYYINLRKALDEHGYSQIRLVGTDDHNPPDYWAVAKEMSTNRAFADAVNILGQHDIAVWRTQQRHCYVSQYASALGKPLWDSENSTQDYAIGFEPLVRAMNRQYIDGHITANFNWALIGSYYGTFPAPGTGLLLADRPWSGWYDLGKSVWVDAHTTQFVQPGWRYLDSACGYTPGGASFVTLRAPDSDDYSIVIETMDLTAPENLEFTVTNRLSRHKVNLWQTHLRSDRAEDHFVKVMTIKPFEGHFQVTVAPGHVYTLSTTDGQGKGDARPRAKSSEQMPLPFLEDFEHTGGDHLAKFFSDVHGGFQAAACGGGRRGNCYRQMLTQEPILWHGAKMPPTTIVGDPLWWGDYEVSVDALLEGSGYVELLGRIEAQQHNVAGYRLQIRDDGGWMVCAQDEPGSGTDTGTKAGQNCALASGTNAILGTNQWHRLALRFRGNEITAMFDGRQLATVHDDSHTSGQVGLRVSAWQHAQFDNFKVTKTAAWPEFIPHSEMKVTATSEYAENDFGSVHLSRNAIDDRVETSWRSCYAPPTPLPQAITLDLGRLRPTCALTYKPELPGADRGTITGYCVYTSQDGRDFDKVASGIWLGTRATKVASWPKRSARYVRLEVTAATGGGNQRASAAEIQVASDF